MFVSIASLPGARYPDASESFSPAEAYPEYRLSAPARTPNDAYAMVRAVLAQTGLDASRFGGPDWNPLGELVPAGASVFVLCNFVHHRRPNESPEDFAGKCIHGSVLRALIDYVLLAVGPAGRVRFGNAPLQSCDWKAVQRDTGADRVAAFYAERKLPVEARDLRLFVTERGAAGTVREVERRDAASAVQIDLGAESLLTEVNGTAAHPARFRVSDYDPTGTESCHRAGSHRYVIHRDVLDADVVISLPKLKTHEKVGITCGLKGFVGAVGHKDCLAHHRYGSPRSGGDEYSPASGFLEPLSAFHEWVHRRPAAAPLQSLAHSADRILRTVARRAGAVTTGAWHGNDTAWRMALDLARILRYADASGALHDTPQRRHLALIDGIVAGEGEGPLDPRAVDAGVLVLGSDVAVTDRIACRLMGFDPDAIPLVREAFRSGARPISDGSREPTVCRLDGVEVRELALVPAAGRRMDPPRGWRAHLDAARSSAA
jgi:uncharacterized protein (DUF362 family)